jgi:hypothetical protein
MRIRSARLPVPRSSPSVVVRSRVRPRVWRQPWVFGSSTLPYVFTTPEDEPAQLADADAPDEEAARRKLPDQVRSVQAALKWNPVKNVGFPWTHSSPGQGLYLVATQKNTPLYVGESGDVHKRWIGRMRNAYQTGLLASNSDLKKIQIWTSSLPVHITKEQRKAIEWSILRVLDQGGLGRSLRNEQRRQPYRTSGPIQISDLLPDVIAARLQTPMNASVASVVDSVRGQRPFVLPPQTIFEVSFYDSTHNTSAGR